MNKYKKLRLGCLVACVTALSMAYQSTALASEQATVAKPAKKLERPVADDTKRMQLPINLFSTAEAHQFEDELKTPSGSASDTTTMAYTAVIWLLGTWAVSLLLLSRERKT